MRLWPVIFLMTACASDKSSEVDDVSDVTTALSLSFDSLLSWIQV